MSHLALIFTAVLTCLVALAQPAHAERAPNTVILVIDPAVLPLARRLTQEIEGLGLEVQTIAADAQQATTSQAQALAPSVVATIHLTPTGGGDVDMTILDGASGKTVTWNVVAPPTAEPAALDLIATRTVELLRASLLELERRRALAAAAARRERAAAPPPPPAPPPSVARLSLTLGPGLLYSAHFRPGVLLQSSLAWLPFEHVGCSFSAYVPLVASRLETSAGTVDAFATLYRLGPLFEIGGVTAPVTLHVVAGIELERLRFEGRPSAPYRGMTETLSAWAPYAGVTTRFRAARSWYVVSELSASFATPRTIVRVANREVSDWGRPLGTASVGLELVWPTTEQR